jgi:hypothetical protein
MTGGDVDGTTGMTGATDRSDGDVLHLRGPIHQLPDLARMSRIAFNDRSALILFALLALVGVALGWNLGLLPAGRDSAAQQPGGPANLTAPDLQLYREVVAAVRSGGDYYDVAHVKIQQFGFPIASPFNWRLPTYAWLFSLLPGPAWIQGALVALSILALVLAFVAESKSSGLGYAAIATFLLFGVVRWAIDGDAYFTQEVWAGTLILISISAYRLAEVCRKSKVEGRRSTNDSPSASVPSTQYSVLRTQHLEQHAAIGWQVVAIFAGLAALAFRELALPYCCVAVAVSLWHRRWWQAAAWSAGIAAFFAFLAWHIGQVHVQLAGSETAAGGGLAQWLRFGGLDFVLLTTRMNSLLFAAPGWLLWLYVCAALIGLARRNDASSQFACLAALAYLGAFALVGRPENFYWGLMAAPLLPWGIAHAPSAVRAMLGAPEIQSAERCPPALTA